MQLSQALRIGKTPRLAFVGSGGKSSALFRLARELISRGSGLEGRDQTVLCTTSTHLALEQLDLADKHIVLDRPEDLDVFDRNIPSGLLLITGAQASQDRMGGIDVACLERLYALAERRQLPLLIEADGSRRRPLKAPAGHEPVIPAWVDQVVVTVGLLGLGKPLDATWVHRPEIFSELAGLPLGAQVTSEALVQVLAHPEGGLKGIPAQAQRICLLNQADTSELQAAASRLAQGLLPAYQAVLVAALQQQDSGLQAGLASPGGHSARLERWRTTGDPPVFGVWEDTAGVILAAGESKRMAGSHQDDAPKQLFEWRGQPFIRHVVKTALAAGLSKIVVVLGAFADQIRPALQGLPVHIVENTAWQAGQSTSIVAGLQVLEGATGSAIFLLADQPQTPAALIQSLVELHASTLAPIVAPMIDGRRGNPVLFDRITFPDLLALSGDVGGRVLFSRYPAAWLPWLDSSAAWDVDTPEDYYKLLERLP
jgi:molybdenum cofactor cytidylyltransferase